MHVIERRESTLENGLRVVVAELPHLHTATIALYVRVGCRFETPDDNGLSHFVEHMLFRGSARYASSYELSFAVERLGATLYAETGRDCGLMSLSVEPNQVAAGLEILGELLASPRFSDIELERKLILEELKEDFDEKDVEINADDIARELLFGDHPMGQRIIGPRSNVERFDADDVRRHFDRLYCARNMLLCVAGPVEAAPVEQAAATFLGQLPAGQAVSGPPLELEQTSPRYKYVSDSGSQTAISLLLRGVAEQDDDYPALAALLRAIDDGMSTRLHYRLCDQLGLAYSVNASIEPLHDISIVDVTANTSHDKVAALIREVLGLLGGMRDQPVSAVELEKLKRRYRYDSLSSTDDPNAIAGQLGGIALYYAPPSLEQRVAQIEALTAVDLQRVAQRVFRPERLSVAIVGDLTRARQAEVRDAVMSWE